MFEVRTLEETKTSCIKDHNRALCPFLDFLAGKFGGSQKRLAARKKRLGLAGSHNSLPHFQKEAITRDLKQLILHYRLNAAPAAAVRAHSIVFYENEVIVDKAGNELMIV